MPPSSPFLQDHLWEGAVLLEASSGPPAWEEKQGGSWGGESLPFHGTCFANVVSSSSLAMICLVFMELWTTYHRSSKQPYFDVYGWISLLKHCLMAISAVQ